MLNVQTYLLTHTLNDLARDHGVYARFSVKNPLKFTLNYDQLEAKDADPISQECRGLILATDKPMDMDTVIGDTRVMALPMKRFFNYGQGSAAPVNLDASDTRFCEKLDGTLCIMYFDRNLGQWCVGTRSVPDADLPMDGFGTQTFSDLFWKAFKASGGTLSGLDYAKGWQTFCFELCTPDNQIVVKYNDYKVFLLAVRQISDGAESLPEGWLEQLGGIEAAPTYKFGSPSEMLDFVSSRNPLAHEGIVVCDKDFNRVKVKNAGYLAYNKIKDSVAKSPRAVLEIVLLGKEDDVMPLVPEHVQNVILSTKDALAAFLRTTDEEYTRCHHTDRKTFALAIQAGSGNMGPHMARWSGRASGTKDWIMGQRKDGSWSDGFLDSLMRMMKA